jgi:ABC-type polysaccharide/polyol phosphate export permease
MISALTPIKAVVASKGLLWHLTLRELRTKYRKSFLGWTWSMLNPLATVGIYSFVFGHLFQIQAPTGNPSGLKVFALYLLCGLLPWNFLMLTTSTGMSALLANASLVKKVSFPREVLVFAQSLHGLVQFSIEMGLFVLVLVIASTAFLPWVPVILFQMLLLLIFGTGLALALSAVNVYFRDLSYLWQIFTQVWFFATPIVYSETVLVDRVSPTVLTILEWNPMAVFARGFRYSLYDGTFPGWVNLGTCTLVSCISMVGGWYVFNRLSRRFAEEL